MSAGEREVFEAIREAGNMALLRGTWRGKSAAFIVAVNEDAQAPAAANVRITPLAVLVTDEMLDDARGPDGEPTTPLRAA